MQRVRHAAVTVDAQVVGRIDVGLLILLGVVIDDGEADLAYVVDKVAGLRIFADADGRMNLDLAAAGGSLLVVSQFTLAGDCRKGRRPSFDAAAAPDLARPLYENVVSDLRASGLTLATGEFQAKMQVTLVNDGPVTLLLDSRKRL